MHIHTFMFVHLDMPRSREPAAYTKDSKNQCGFDYLW